MLRNAVAARPARFAQWAPRMPKKPKLRVPPFNDQPFPHETFPPWNAIERIFDVLGRALRRDSATSNLRLLQSPLLEASERIVAIAGGELPVHRWWRRVRVTIDYLDRARVELERYVGEHALSESDANAIAAGIERTIRFLLDAVAAVPLPDEVRAELPELRPPARALH